MAPVTIEEDYYVVLGVLQNASAEEVTKAYRRLSLILHPDRNKQQNATEAFQALGMAYETLKDESKRHEYDILHYPRIKTSRQQSFYAQSGASARDSYTSHPGATSTRSASHSTPPVDDRISTYTTEIATIFKKRQGCVERWAKTKKVYDDAIFEATREIRKLQSAIKDLESIERAEAAEAAAANSWTMWILSPLYTKPVESEEEKERKDRERLQRVHTKDIKQNSLQQKKTELQGRKDLLAEKEGGFLAAKKQDDEKIYMYEGWIRQIRQEEQRKKERVEKQEKDRRWREQVEKLRKEDEERRKRQEKEAAEQDERWRKEQTERLTRARELEKQQRKQARELAERRRKEAQERADALRASASRFPAAHDFCYHDGWWPKVEGYKTCEKCSARYSYLLRCPSCSILACASCQHDLRPAKRSRRTMN